MKYIIDEQDYEDFVRVKESLAKDTRPHPNSFGHGYSVGQIESLREIKEFALKED